MIRTTWNAFYQFQCMAQDCPDSCCQDWEVDIDEKTANFYRTMTGSLGDRLRNVLKTEDGSTAMRLENGRCPMWRQDGLCRIQAEMGHDALCQVCQEYPRLIMDYGDFSEWGLEMSCPEAARLLFADMSVTEEILPGGETPEYDTEVMELLRQSRRQILEYWEKKACSVPEALAATLLFAHKVQSAIDSGESLSCVPEKYRLVPEKSGSSTLLLDFFKSLEIMMQSWKNRLDNPQTGTWDGRLRQFAKYLIRRYWLHGVWDFDLVSRARLIAASCILVNLLGGDTVQTVRQFAKEIENDPENMDAILDAAYSHPAFTDDNLLSLLA